MFVFEFYITKRNSIWNFSLKNKKTNFPKFKEPCYLKSICKHTHTHTHTHTHIYIYIYIYIYAHIPSNQSCNCFIL